MDFKKSVGGLDNNGRVENLRKHELYLTGMHQATSPKVKNQKVIKLDN